MAKDVSPRGERERDSHGVGWPCTAWLLGAREGARPTAPRRTVRTLSREAAAALPHGRLPVLFREQDGRGVLPPGVGEGEQSGPPGWGWCASQAAAPRTGGPAAVQCLTTCAVRPPGSDSLVRELTSSGSDPGSASSWTPSPLGTERSQPACSSQQSARCSVGHCCPSAREAPRVASPLTWW